MFGGIGAGGQLALNRCFDQHVGVGDQRIDGIDTGVEIVLNGVEVAVVVVGDAGRDVSLADFVDVVGGHVQADR